MHPSISAMVAFDTNHSLRHILQDHPKQCKHVAALLEAQIKVGQQILIIDLVVMETCWVLSHVYNFDKAVWTHVLESLLSDTAFIFEDPAKLRRALKHNSKGKADFNDYLILVMCPEKSGHVILLSRES